MIDKGIALGILGSLRLYLSILRLPRLPLSLCRRFLWFI